MMLTGWLQNGAAAVALDLLVVFLADARSGIVVLQLHINDRQAISSPILVICYSF
jgi:hypothetical protein